MSFDPMDAFTGETSDCCGARVFLGGICAACGEHCDIEKEEDERPPDAWPTDRNSIQPLNKHEAAKLWFRQEP